MRTFLPGLIGAARIDFQMAAAAKARAPKFRAALVVAAAGRKCRPHFVSADSAVIYGGLPPASTRPFVLGRVRDAIATFPSALTAGGLPFSFSE